MCRTEVVERAWHYEHVVEENVHRWAQRRHPTCCSVGQWCFVLSSIHSLVVLDSGSLDSEDVRALIEILVRLLKMGVHIIGGDPTTYTDFWLYITMSILDEGTPVQHGPPRLELTSSRWVLDARGIGAYGDSMTRDPKYIH